MSSGCSPPDSSSSLLFVHSFSLTCILLAVWELRQLLCGLSRKQGSSPVYWVYSLSLLPFNGASSAAKFEKQCASCGPLARRCILYIFGIHLCIHVYHFFERSLAKGACIWSKIILWNTILQITIAAFFFNVLTSNVFIWCKAEFSASLLQFSVSHDPSEIILICRFSVQETRLITINVVNSCAFMGTMVSLLGICDDECKAFIWNRNLLYHYTFLYYHLWSIYCILAKLKY